MDFIEEIRNHFVQLLPFLCIFFYKAIYICIYYHISSQLVLNPENIATVEEGRPLTLTCQSNESSGIYRLFYIDAHGNRISYGSGGGAFLSCTSSTNQANMECEFGIS